MSPPLQRVVIAGGGTGGHVYPGVAVAEEILARNPDARVLFVGSAHGLETQILPRLGYTLETITVSRLKGGGLLERLLGLARLPVGMLQSWRLLRRVNPQVVLGVGGYASGPALLAAWMTCRRTAIQEQNATPGLTNRVLGRLARGIFVGFEAAAQHFQRRTRLVVTGNPLRRAVADALRDAEGRAQRGGAGLSVLVFGGSQGARFLNERVPEMLAALGRHLGERGLTVVHQSGAAEEAATRQRYADLGLPAEVTPFIHDMPAAYAAADVAICRAGALTIAELTAVGLPAVLVPFPFAADNHQEANARVMADRGAGLLVRQADWQLAEVAQWLSEAAADPARLQAMSRSSRALARIEAAAAVVDELEGIAA